jgi:hypothetical protein
MFAGGWASAGDRYDTTSAVYRRIAKLAAMRKGNRAFTRGGLDVRYDTVAGAGSLLYRRTLGAETVLVLLNTAREPALVASADTGLPEGSVLEVLHAEASPPAPEVGAGGRLTMVLPPKAVLVARATGRTVTPPSPGATIAVSSAIEGQTFDADVVFTGSVTPATTSLRMVLDGSLSRATPVTVAPDGSWSVVLPVSSFPSGTALHDVAFWAPGVRVATQTFRFTTDVSFAGDTYVVADPEGDDVGPAGTYTYPLDATFGAQMDVTEVKLEVGATTMNVNVTLADFSTVWNPPYGFDHVALNLYFALPGQAGVSFMPKLNGSTPPGFAWSLNQFSFGWDNVMYTSAGATAEAYGAPTTPPAVRADPNARTITFTYDRNAYGLASWSGVRVYVATWDFDGIGAMFRPLAQQPGLWRMGGGGPPYTPDPVDPLVLYSGDPKIMDDVPPIAIP